MKGRGGSESVGWFVENSEAHAIHLVLVWLGRLSREKK